MSDKYIERARDALTSSARFCSLMADARSYGHSLYWDGSAFRSHPVGIICGVIKMTNHWNTSDLCSIYITDGDGWDAKNVCQDSCANGSPHPKATNGAEIRVWINGAWESSDFESALGEKVIAILADVAEHVEREKIKKKSKRLQEANEFKAKLAEKVALAISKAKGVPHES